MALSSCLAPPTREDRIARAEAAERRAELETVLPGLDHDVLDQLAGLNVDAEAIASALTLGRELLQAHRADAPLRRRDHAREQAIRRRGSWPLVVRELRPGIVLADDGHAVWRHAPQPSGRGNPELGIRAHVCTLLTGLGVASPSLRDALLATLRHDRRS